MSFLLIIVMIFNDGGLTWPKGNDLEPRQREPTQTNGRFGFKGSQAQEIALAGAFG